MVSQTRSGFPHAPWCHGLSRVFLETQPDEQADMILKKPKPMIVADICPSCGGTGKAVRPHPKNVIRLSVPDCQRCKGAGRMKPY
jgi:hypothetical protein